MSRRTQLAPAVGFMLLGSILAGFLPPRHAHSQASAPPQADSVEETLLLATDDYEHALALAAEKVLARFDTLITSATQNGRLDELKDLQAQRLSFESSQVLPDSPSLEKTTAAFQMARDRARKQLIAAHDTAIAAYTRASDVARAEQVQAARDRLLQEFSQPATNRPEPTTPAQTLDARGEPIDFLNGRSRGLAAVWLDDQGICHVRFSPGATGRRFEGTITVRNGAWATPVTPVLTGQSRKPDRGDFTSAATFAYEIHTPKNGLDGLDFQVAGPRADIIFEMKANGALIPADSIVIGKSSTHPPGGQFAITNRPSPPRRRR